jgi:hypothetical protein
LAGNGLDWQRAGVGAEVGNQRDANLAARQEANAANEPRRKRGAGIGNGARVWRLRVALANNTSHTSR